MFDKMIQIIKIKPNIENFRIKVNIYLVFIFLKAAYFLMLALTFLISRSKTVNGKFFFDIVCDYNSDLYSVLYFLSYFLFEFVPVLISISLLRPRI